MELTNKHRFSQQRKKTVSAEKKHTELPIKKLPV